MAPDLFGEAHLEPSTAADDPAAQAAAARVRASVVALRGLEDRRRIAARLEELGLAARDALGSRPRGPCGVPGDGRLATRPRLR